MAKKRKQKAIKDDEGWHSNSILFDPELNSFAENWEFTDAAKKKYPDFQYMIKWANMLAFPNKTKRDAETDNNEMDLINCLLLNIGRIAGLDIYKGKSGIAFWFRTVWNVAEDALIPKDKQSGLLRGPEADDRV